MTKIRPSFKRLIACCDGTWVNALGKEGTQDQPSNVTRISRLPKNNCDDGTNQIVYYHAGVGSSGTTLDALEGAFGGGLEADIREIYNFITNNYSDGDDIILLGFSRGAFTARSVADLIASVGLLTYEGLDHFYNIFIDYENLGNKDRDVSEFLFHGLQPYKGQKGKELILWEDERKKEYRAWLEKAGYTKTTYEDGVTEITIKAIGVWDTVGSLGVPPLPVIGFAGSTNEWKFTNTAISHKVQNGFQALALDEPRAAFSPALWERMPSNTTTNLRQVWFPGSHANIGGGWPDQQIADISLAWMLDQLTSIGVQFSLPRLTTLFTRGLRYSAAHPFPYVPSSNPIPLPLPHILPSKPLPWANSAIFPPSEAHLHRDTAQTSPNDPSELATSDNLVELWNTARPWGLGQIRHPGNWIENAAGTIVRRPGLFMRVDPTTNEPTSEPLLDTDERIHSCVRVRLACGGLAMDDKQVWDCEPLTKSPKGRPLWRLERGQSGLEERFSEMQIEQKLLYPVQDGDDAWRWVYTRRVTHDDDDEQEPQSTVLPEEPLTGYWQRYLLALTTGKQDVWRWAVEHPPKDV